MARTIPHRELRNNSSAVLREVRDGETINITNGGELVAVLTPPPPEGRAPSLRVRKAVTRGNFGRIKGIDAKVPSKDLLDDLRGDR
jgi:prevent-host-death family protein